MSESSELRHGSSASNENNSHHNNNKDSYTGRLKFYKEGRCLLELTHRDGKCRGQSWIPISKKVYWPPSGPTNAVLKAENTLANQPETFQYDDSNISRSSCQRPRRKNLRPSKNNFSSELSFVMFPPPCISSLRKKVRGLCSKRKNPYEAIHVGSFLLRLEYSSGRIRPKRKPLEKDHILKSSRLESVISKLTHCKKKGLSSVSFSIGSWNGGGCGGGTTTKSKKASKLISSSSNKVKSELCYVTETCIVSSASPLPTKVKAPLKAISSEPRNPSSSSLTPKSLSRVKGGDSFYSSSNLSLSSSSSSGSLVNPDIKRVKIEISSPRKRSSSSSKDHGDGSPKRHRLSTDSLGDGSHSPSIASPPSSKFLPHRKTSFSIDSIMNSRLSSESQVKNVSNSPLVSITPFGARGGNGPLDPRLAHLAGLAADPRLGLNPLNPYYCNNPFLQAAAVAAVAAAAAAAQNSQYSSSSSSSSLPWSRRMSSSSSRSNESGPSGIGGPFWPPQYRDEPKVENIRSSSPDSPLNLSMK